jgi:tetraacyldisaccharide 4'-kinase
MKKRGLAVHAGADRLASARRAVADGAGVLLLDDGLQHHALQRDLDIIVADASNPLGNGHVLPMGPLRELPSRLSRVRRGLVWLTHCELPHHPRLVELPKFPQVESRYVARAELRGKRVFAFAGIARPEHFMKTLLDLGAEISGTRWFRDHHRFSAAELAELRRTDAQLVTTEKDLVRIADPSGIMAVPIEVEILRGEDALQAALDEVLK